MAGAVTHMLVAEKAAQLLTGSDDPLGSTLQSPAGKSFLFMGAVSPDLPYLGGMLRGEAKWADRMHYERTNLLACAAAVSPGIGNYQSSLNRAFIAWLAGYIAHCVVDAVVHPVVNLIVGPYKDNKVAHRQCELYQDALLFDHLKQRDLRDSQFVHSLKQCESDDACGCVAENWGAGLKWAYRRPTQPDTAGWLHWYRMAVDAASDSDILFLLSRPFKGSDTLVYRPAEELRESAALCKRYFDDVPVPPLGAKRGPFADRVLSCAVGGVQVAWAALSRDISCAEQMGGDWREGGLQQALRNWDLDTGLDQDLPGTPMTYWPA